MGSKEKKLFHQRKKIQQQFLAAVQEKDLDGVRHYLRVEQQVNNTKDNTQGVKSKSFLVNHNNNEALLIAATNNDFRMGHLLFDYGATQNQPNFEGWCPIHCASSLGHNEFCLTLIKRRDQDDQWCDVNLFTNKGLTPLMLAVVGNYPPVVDTLLWLAEANKKLLDKHSNMTAMDYAKQWGHSIIMKQFTVGIRCVGKMVEGNDRKKDYTDELKSGSSAGGNDNSIAEEKSSILVYNAIDRGWRPVGGL